MGAAVRGAPFRHDVLQRRIGPKRRAPAPRSSALSLANYSALGQVMSDTALIADYLSLSIPMISYLLVSASGMMMASLARGVVQSYEAPVGKAADEATTGGISLGNTSIGNASWWAQNTPLSWNAGRVSWYDRSGTRNTLTPARGHFVDVPGSHLPFSDDITQAACSAIDTRASETLQAVRTELADYGKMVSANCSDM